MQSLRNIFLLCCLLLLVGGCAAGRSAFNKGEDLEQQGKLDEAVLKYAEAATANPSVAEYRVRFLKAGVEAAKKHQKSGDAFLEAKNYDEALREYQTAFTLDPSLEIARQQAEHVMKLRSSLVYFREGEELEKGHKLREALRSYQKAADLDSGNKEARDAVERLVKARRPKMDGFELNLKSNKPITLKFKDAKIKEVFTILSQLSGINFIFDEGVKDQNVSVFLENASFPQTLDILLSINKLSKKVLNETTIIVYPRSPEKVKQYEELMVQTFYLNKLEAKKAVNLIRTMLQVKKIYVNEELNALVLRDTADVIEVARKIIEANDVPDGEVVLEVEVVEIAKNKADTFGLALSKYNVSLNTLAPDKTNWLSDTFTPATTTTIIPTGSTTAPTAQSTANNLLNVFNWRGFGGFITVPNATFNFGKSLANGESLANPKLRVKNREKAKFNVGTRVPITTTSSPTGGGVSVNVQYVDVGVKLNAEPTIQLNNDVSIKLSLEVSSILSRDKVGDSTSLTTVVTIGTRNLDTVLNLKDGETSIIGGLIQDNKSTSKKKIWLLGDIPILGSLLSSTDDTNDKTELVLAITPRLVRGVTIPDADVSSFWSGREDDPVAAKLYSSFQDTETEASPGAAQPAGAQMPKGGAAPAPGKPMLPVPAPPAAQTMPATPPNVPAAAPEPPQRVMLNLLAPPTVKVNDQFRVEIKVSDAKNLYNSPFTLVYDPLFLDFVGIEEGPFLKSDGKPTLFKTSLDANGGKVAVTLGRVGDVPGVTGAGTIATAIFKAKNQGPASLGFIDANFVAAGGKPLETLPYNTAVEVQ
ncbi:cohesin domain-containing protein [Geomobilimonas luticola]|uniref:Type II secretion system protein n=1 Tax=Geomobilimonas luticola TaxID=1114878 RepID=A0ABS5SGF2_9BACT|nr:cohesin domain-containing protein [Geomobilimonas luticola]MBT0654443.1 type II secretion system protein [Geomobilimonas luticola]